MSKAALFAVVAISTTSASAHPFHVSLAEVQHNAQTNRLEIALRVHPSDLEKALRRMTGRKVDLEKTRDVDKLIAKYLGDVFVVKPPDGKPAALKWVGKEITLKTAWLYFEAPVAAELKNVRLTNRVFFELLSDQKNLVNLSIGKRKTSLVFTRDRPTQPLAGSAE